MNESSQWKQGWCAIGAIASAARAWARDGLDRVPRPAGAALARLPWRLRLGAPYARHRYLQDAWDTWSGEQRHGWLIERLNSSAALAREIPYYQQHWGSDVAPDAIADLADFSARVPESTKDDLRHSSPDERAVQGASSRGRLLNTGGTSGSPLSFYVEPDSWAREWAHMGRIWTRVGWKPGASRLTVRGHNLGETVLQYRASHNEFVLNTFAPPASWARHLEELFSSRSAPIFVHGYPSSLFLLVRELESDAAGRDVLDLMRRVVRGVLLGSEFPAQRLREEIEDAFGAPSQSWYGHSEMAALAVEEPDQRYRALQTYGYLEAVPVHGQQDLRLVVSGFWNDVAPLLRYDTGDLITDPRWSAQGVLESFKISQGRGSDFVVDRSGNLLPLTALIFGRHHRAFELLKSVQVRQEECGTMQLVCVPVADAAPADIGAAFDFSGVDIAYEIEMAIEPIRVSSGKTPLLLRPSE